MQPPDNVVRGEALSRHTSLKVGGPAEYFATARDRRTLGEVLGWADGAGVPVRLIGGGTNLLVSDAGVEGLVVKAVGSHYEVVEREGQPVLLADAGLLMASAARRLAKQGYGGLEWAANVPGTIGGAVVNNAGAFGGDLAAHLITAEILHPSGDLERLGPEELEYAYRTSRLKRRELGIAAVLRAELRLERSTAAAATGLVASYQEQRTRSQPRILSAGSVFANPEGSFSGKLIEGAGLKGTRVGGAQISPQHANFIVNLGGATARDVFVLMEMVQKAVNRSSGTWLRPEIELLGRWTEAERRLLAEPHL